MVSKELNYHCFVFFTGKLGSKLGALDDGKGHLNLLIKEHIKKYPIKTNKLVTSAV